MYSEPAAGVSVGAVGNWPGPISANLGFLVAVQRQEWQARWAAIIAIQVHGILYAGDAEFSNYALGGEFHALLFFLG